MPFHQWLFLLLVLLLPSQLAYHFWPNASLVFGIRVDYLAPTIYLTDILVGLVLFSWWVKARKIILLSAGDFLIPAAFIYLFLTSLFIAQNQAAALVKLLKLSEFFLLGFYVYKNWGSKLWSRVKQALSLGIFYTTVIAALQFYFGRTLGGVFWWLGERTFSVTDPGIARVTFLGQEFLRPYATFPHPNALAGFALVSLILFLPAREKLLRLGVVLAAFLVFISFSQGAWVAAAVVASWWVLAKTWPQKKKLLNWLALGGIAAVTLVPVAMLAPAGLPEEISFRWQLAQTAKEMFLSSPIFGVGLANFVPRLPEFSQTPQVFRWLQPAHNIFLLVAAEIGIVGLAGFLWFIYKAVQKLVAENRQMMTVLLAILLTGALDHYWLTLQQNQLLLATFIGAVFAQNKKG